jgi:hypothetical protein
LSAKHFVSGLVRDARGSSVPDLLVEAYDQHFGIASDFVGSAFSDPSGKFEIVFQTQDFKSRFDIFETKTNLYIVVRDEYRVVYASETRKEASPNDLYFDVILPSITSETYSEPFDDPYSNNVQTMISEFSSVGDSISQQEVSPLRTVPQLIRSINSFIHFSDPRVTKLYGYPGPQLPGRPKESEPHSHFIPWTAERWKEAGIEVPDSFWQYPSTGPSTKESSFMTSSGTGGT